MSAKIGLIFFFEIGIKKVLFFVCSELRNPAVGVQRHGHLPMRA